MMDLMLHSSITQVLPVGDLAQARYAIQMVQRLAEQIGFGAGDTSRVMLVVMDLAETMLELPSGGELHTRSLPLGGAGIEIVALYHPPSFDKQAPTSDGFRTGTQGNELYLFQQQADVFDMHIDARGTVILTRFYPRAEIVKDLRFGVTQHSLRDDPACGDVWEIAIQSNRVSLLMIDGLGHGVDAEVAAMAGAKAFNRSPFAEPRWLLEEIHGEMRGTRGGVLAIAQFDAAQDRLSFIGIGDIGAVVVGWEKTRGLASYPGIVGHHYRKGAVASLEHCADQLLILYSDGLKSRWNLQDYEGLMHRHPAVIAAVLNRDFSRGTDDVTVIVMALEEA